MLVCISVERLLSQWETYRTWYSVDALGSLRATLDDAGVPIAAANYDAWGVPETPLIAPFGFTGELQQGSDVWLRARWYGAGRGSFASRDPFAGMAQTPYSLQYYQYAYAAPTVWTDARGEVVDPGNTEGHGGCRSDLKKPWTLELPSKPLGAIDQYQLVRCLAPEILHYASIHAMPQFGFTRNVTAAVIGAIMMMETGTDNWQEIYGNWPLSRALNLVPHPAGFFDRTVPISNLRPGVVIEIFNCEIPLGEQGIHEPAIITADLRLTYITKQGFLTDPSRTTGRARSPKNAFVLGDKARISHLLVNDNDFAIDMLGADIQRAIIRANLLGLRPSIFNVATWHNGGTQAADGIKAQEAQGRGIGGYGETVAMDLVDIAARLLEIPAPPKGLRYNHLPDDMLRDEKQFIRNHK